MKSKLKILMPDVMKVEHNVRVLQEAKSLIDVGYFVKIIGFSNKTKRKYFKVNGIDVVSFYLHDERKGFGKIIRYLTAFKMIIGIQIQVLFTEADVYHAHNFHVLPICFLSALIHKGKLIYDTHETWTIHRKQKFHPEHIFAFIIEKIFIRFIDGFITVNGMIIDYYKEKYGIKNGIFLLNTRELVPLKKQNLIREELNLSEDKKIVLFVGGLWPHGRGIFELIETGKYLDDNTAIVFIGYGSNNMLSKMKTKIEELALQKEVYVLGAKPSEKVMDYIMSADIGMNIIKREARAQDFQSPWKLFEYLMSGLPVISTDLLFHRKIYENHEIGFLCDSENSPKSIADSIKKIIVSEKLNLFKENARNSAETIFNWESQAKKLLKLYKELL